MIRVNERVFDEKSIVQEMQYHQAESQEQAKSKACQALIIGELLKQRADKLGLCVASKSVEDDYLEQLLEQEVSMPEASVDACKTYFESNPKKFTTTPLVEASHILLPAAPDNAAERRQAREQADKLIALLAEDINLFAELAALHSACPSAKTGGSLGQLSKGQTVPEFERQLFNCEEGLVGAPIESRYGMHVVLIARRVAGRPLPFIMVEQRIADYLNEKVRRKAIAQYIETLITQAQIEGYDFSVSGSPLMQ